MFDYGSSGTYSPEMWVSCTDQGHAACARWSATVGVRCTPSCTCCMSVVGARDPHLWAAGPRCTFSDALDVSNLTGSSIETMLRFHGCKVHGQRIKKCSGVYECSRQTYKTQYALTVAVIHSSSRDTIFSKNARARPSLTSSNIPVVLTSKCLQQHIVCDQKQLSHSANLLCMLQLAMAPEHAGNTAAYFAVCRSDGFNLSALLARPCCMLKTQCMAFTWQEFVQCSDACSRCLELKIQAGGLTCDQPGLPA